MIPGTEPAVRADRVVKRFGRISALRGIDLEAAPGERIALFGPNGSGKTTLLKVLAGLTRPTRGHALLHGLDHKRGGQALRGRIGVVSHHTYLYDDLTAEENLLFYGRIYGLEDLQQRVNDGLHWVGMERRRHDKVRTFSRGMQQRLALARSDLHNPDVLLLDEPDTGLDQEAPELLEQLFHRPGIPRRAVLMATHDLELGAALCSRFVVLADGKTAYESKPGSHQAADVRELYRSHASPS